MKKLFVVIALSGLVHTGLYAQHLVAPEQVTGAWNGVIEAGAVKLRVVFNIASGVDGKLTATTDSPDQGAKGIPVQDVQVKGDSLLLKIPAINGSYAGKITSAETIAGVLNQGGASTTLHLKKGAAMADAAPKRPQMPQRPYPYKEVDVVVSNTEAGITLGGTLTIPSGKGPHAAVILFTGSGSQDRDMTLMGHKPYLVLSDHLTRQGIAVLRLDDRGIGQSGGDPSLATTQDFTTDAMAAYAFLKTRKEINPKKIGLLGLSEGAFMAAQTAAKNKDVAFVVLLAGPALPGIEMMVLQNEVLLKNSGLPAGLVSQFLSLRRAQFEVSASDLDTPDAAQKIASLETEALARMSSQEQAMLGLNAERVQATATTFTSPWWRYAMRYDQGLTLRQLKMPALALNGSKDMQVPATENLAATEKALKTGGNRNFTVKELQGLNHLFQVAETGHPSEYRLIEQTMAPIAMETISTWIMSVVK
jgi:uncharacterized protein